MKSPHTTSRGSTFRVLFSVLVVLGLILTSLPASPARPLATTAQEEIPFPPEGEWHTYANGDDVLVLEMEGDVLWAGTRAGGLVRWDTTDGTFVQYLKPQDGLAGNVVRDIYIDAGGHKWLATDHGLSVLDDNGTPEKTDDIWHTYTRESTAGNLPSNRVTAVARDEAGFLWIGTSQYWDQETEAYAGGGLAKVDTKGTLDPADDEWLHNYNVANTWWTTGANDLRLGLASDNITDILPVPGNRVWVATRQHWAFRQFDTDPGKWLPVHGGLSRLDHAGTPEDDDDTWQTWTCESGPQRNTSISCVIHGLKLDANGYVWAAMANRGVIAFPYDGTYLSAVSFDEFDGLATGHVTTLAFGHSDDAQWQNTVWIGTYDAATGAGRGVCVLDHNGTIGSRGDDVWNGTNPDGECLTTENGLPGDRVQAMVAGAGKLWMGIGGHYGAAHGITPLDLGQQFVQKPLTTAGTGLPYNYVTDLAVGQGGTRWENQVWVATGNMRERQYGVGALLLNTQGTEDTADDVWTQFTKEGTDNDGVTPWTGLASNSVTALAVIGDDVWVGTQPATWDADNRRWTDGGVSVYNGEQWTIRTDANTGGEFSGLRDDTISALAPGCTGEIWTALGSFETSGALGINVFDPMGQPHNRGSDVWQDPITHPTIPSNLVTEIASDCGRNQMWIATAPFFTSAGLRGGGLARYDYATGEWTAWTTEDGIESFRESRSDAYMTSIAVGADGIPWAGAWGKLRLSRQELLNNRPYIAASLNWLQGDTWASLIFENDGKISALAVDGNGVVWAGTSRGGMDWNADGNEDDVVAGRAVGGIKLTIDGTQTVAWTPDNSPLVTNDIEVIEIAEDGTVWIGTNGWGIMRFRPSILQNVTPTPTHTKTPTLTPTPTATATPVPTRDRTTLYLPLVGNNWLRLPTPAPTVADLP